MFWFDAIEPDVKSAKFKKVIKASQREFIMHLSALDMEVKMKEKYKSKHAGNYTPKVNELYNIYVGRMKAHQ